MNINIRVHESSETIGDLQTYLSRFVEAREELAKKDPDVVVNVEVEVN